MFTLYPFAQLGHARHGWLNARHHFSFARYHNPARMGFGALRVVNDDIIQAGEGFGMHPHENMEIITYVRQGAISHQDSAGNKGRTAAGDVQVMSAGSGVFHAEHNREAENTQLYQIWILPHTANVPPRWEGRRFPKEWSESTLPLLVSGQPEHKNSGVPFIYQDAAMYGGKVKAGTTLTLPLKHQAYVLASAGTFTVNGHGMEQGDGAEVTDEPTLTLHATTDAEIVVLDIPA